MLYNQHSLDLKVQVFFSLDVKLLIQIEKLYLELLLSWI